jgi:signal transduction histidine kinase
MKAVGSDESGLGLFIARRLMEEQDGSIEVEPRAGGGTSVVLRFRLPQEKPPVDASIPLMLTGTAS